MHGWRGFDLQRVEIKCLLRISVTKSLEHTCSNTHSAARVAASYFKADASEDSTDESSETHQVHGLFAGQQTVCNEEILGFFFSTLIPNLPWDLSYNFDANLSESPAFRVPN